VSPYKIQNKNKRKFGEAIEQEVQLYLQNKGLKLVQKNFLCKAGEIDLIMREKNALAFVEVRFRKSAIFGSGAETVTYRKQRRIIKTAQYFLLKYPSYANFACRFDVVSVQPDDNNQYNTIQWIPNAFEAYS